MTILFLFSISMLSGYYQSLLCTMVSQTDICALKFNEAKNITSSLVPVFFTCQQIESTQ